MNTKRPFFLFLLLPLFYSTTLHGTLTAQTGGKAPALRTEPAELSVRTTSAEPGSEKTEAQYEFVIAFHASVNTDKTGKNLIKELPDLQKRGINPLFLEIGYN